MADVVLTCRATWKRLGVSAKARSDLESELTADLAAAAADGVDASRFVGGDPAGFAQEWAIARGLVRARWHVLGCCVVSSVVGFAFLMLIDWLVMPIWPYDPGPPAARPWLLLYTPVAMGFLIPALAAVGFYLAAVRDTLLARTVVVLLVTSPVSVWLSAQLTRRMDGSFVRAAAALLFAVLFALGVGALRAGVVWASRRTASSV